MLIVIILIELLILFLLSNRLSNALYRLFWVIFKNKYIKSRGTERIKRRISIVINSFLRFLHEYFGITNYKPCWCKGYALNHPCASQVKEKFGTLRFYLTSGTDEMFDLVHEYERRSEIICEACGSNAELRNDQYWYSTLCEKCAIDQNGNRIPTAKEVSEEEER